MTHFDWLDRANTIQHITQFQHLGVFLNYQNENGGNIEIILKITE